MVVRRFGWLLGCGVVGLVAVGCQSSSVRTHRSYEYNGSSPPPPQKQEPTEREELESDYEMVQPGEMVVEPD